MNSTDSDILMEIATSSAVGSKKKEKKRQHHTESSRNLNRPTKKRVVEPLSPMLKWLLSDRDTPTLVLCCLEFKDLASINSTCKGWYQFMSQLTRIVYPETEKYFTNPRYISEESTRLPQFRLSNWLHAFVDTAYVFVTSKPDWSRSSLKRMKQDLVALTYFHNMEVLSLTVQLHLLKDMPLQQCFAALSVTLISLDIECEEVAFKHIKLLQLLFDPIGELTRLRDLDVRGPWANCPLPASQIATFQSLSFAFLLHLPEIESFFFRFNAPLSKLQLQHLLKCPLLHEIPWTAWIGQHSPSLDCGRSRKQWIAEGLAMLHQLPLRYVHINKMKN